MKCTKEHQKRIKLQLATRTSSGSTPVTSPTNLMETREFAIVAMEGIRLPNTPAELINMT